VPQTSSKATAALVCGIVGLALCGPVGIAAIVFARQAEAEISASGGQLTGQGLAQAGRIMGWIAVGLMIVAAVIILIAVMVGVSTNS
jgi:uncharacterized protein DUF4190